MFDLVLWLHILSCVVALGTTMTYFLWFLLAKKNPETVVPVLKTVKRIDDWMANPAYVLAFLTGAALLDLADKAEGFAWSNPWLIEALILYAVVSVVGLGVFSPLLRRQIKLAAGEGTETPAYRKVRAWSEGVGSSLVVLTAVITFLMVVKPNFW